MIEFPQTTSNLTAAGENLFALIRGRNLLVYPDEQIRTAVLHEIVVCSLCKAFIGYPLPAKRTK